MRQLKFNALVLSLVSILMLTGCGFKLRGLSNELPEALTIKVESNKLKVSPFVSQAMKAALEQESEGPVILVKLTKSQFRNRVLVLDENAQSAKQLLMFKLNYSYKNEYGVEGENEISLSRNYFVNSAGLASSSQYEESIKREILHEASYKLKFQLISQLGKSE